jgi:hypothetical protein
VTSSLDCLAKVIEIEEASANNNKFDALIANEIISNG